MKNFTKLATMLLCGTFALGFTACSSDDDDNNTEVTINPVPTVNLSSSSTFQDSLQAATSDYLNKIVFTTYKNLQESAATLHEKCQALYAAKQAGDVSQTTIHEACEAFKEARRYWEQSEAFLYGPATDDGIDPHMDSWPLDQSQMTQAMNSSAVIAGITGSNAAQYVYENNKYFDSTLGFHGLEFVLFRNGAERTADAYNAQYETFTGMTSVTTLSEAAFAAAVSGDLQNMTKLLEYEWDGDATCKSYILNNASWVLGSSQYADHTTGNFTSGNTYGYNYFTLKLTGANTWNYSLANILDGGCSNICQEVYTQKLGQAYRVATNQGTFHIEDGDTIWDARDYIESPYSKRSFQDYQDNIYGIRNVLYGALGTYSNGVANENVTIQPNSFMAIMQRHYPDYATLNNALTTAISTLEAAKQSGKAFVDYPGDDQVKACIDAVEALDDALGDAAEWAQLNMKVQ